MSSAQQNSNNQTNKESEDQISEAPDPTPESNPTPQWSNRLPQPPPKPKRPDTPPPLLFSQTSYLNQTTTHPMDPPSPTANSYDGPQAPQANDDNASDGYEAIFASFVNVQSSPAPSETTNSKDISNGGETGYEEATGVVVGPYVPHPMSTERIYEPGWEHEGNGEQRGRRKLRRKG